MNIYILLKSVLVLILAFFIAVVLQFQVNPNSTRWFFILTPFFTFLVNYLAYTIASGKSSVRNFNIQISTLFGIKFAAYLILALVYFLMEKDNAQRLVFISFIFIVYLLNTIVLLKAIVKQT